MRNVVAAALIALAGAAQASTVGLDINPVPAPDLPESMQITKSSPLDDLLDQINSALEQKPEDGSLWYRAGTVQYHLGRRNKAAEAWAKAHEIDRIYPTAAIMADVQEVFRLQNNGKPDEAQAQLRAATEAHADNPYFHLLTAEQAMRARAYDAAEQAYLKARDLDPDFVAPYLNLGRYYEFRNDQKLARANYQKAVEVAPDYAMAWDFLGAHQFSGGQIAAAYESLRKAEELDPERPLAEARLGNLYAGINDRIGARYWYSRALERATEGRYALLVALSDAQMRLGLLEEAEEALDEALADNQSAPVLVARGYVAEEAGEYEQALASYRDAIIADPGNIVASNNLAMLLIKLDKNHDEALAHAKYVFERQGGNTAIFGTYALALAQNGDETAPALLARAVRLAPDDPWLRYYLGRALIDAGDREGARMHLDAVSILDPDFPRLGDVKGLLAN